MTITYANGTTLEGIVLMRAEGFIRVALRGCRDSVEFVPGPNGTWISEYGEPVQMGDEPVHTGATQAIEEFICSQDEISRLVGSLQMASTCTSAAGLM
jgi:hypothetical protein